MIGAEKVGIDVDPEFVAEVDRVAKRVFLVAARETDDQRVSAAALLKAVACMVYQVSAEARPEYREDVVQGMLSLAVELQQVDQLQNECPPEWECLP